MELTKEQEEIGKGNFSSAVSVSRRDFIKGAAAGTAGLGAAYFGYAALEGEPVKTGFIGTGDEGNVLITQHPPAYMDIVAIADLRPTNLDRAIHGDGNEARVGLTQEAGTGQGREDSAFCQSQGAAGGQRRAGFGSGRHRRARSASISRSPWSVCKQGCTSSARS